MRSSLARSFGFGLLPKTNYVRLSMDMNASQPVYLRGARAGDPPMCAPN
jgi:hypothetical protein